MLRWPDRQHRTGSFGNNFFGRRSPQRAGQSAPAVRHHRCQIDLVIPRGFGNLVRRFTFDDHRLDFQTIKERIGEQVPNLSLQLQQPMLFLIFQDAGRQRHQIRRYLCRLHAQQDNSASTFARERGCVFQRRTRVWREVRREENVSE